MRTGLVIILALGTRLAAANPKPADLEALFSNNVEPGTSKLVFDSTGVHVDTAWTDANTDHKDRSKLLAPTIGSAAGGKVFWVATGVQRRQVCGGLTGDNLCKDHLPKDTAALLLLEAGDTPDAWHPIVAHVAVPITDQDAIKARAKGTKLDAIARRIEPAAEEAEKLFEASIADPKQLGASVSDRKDAVLLGSAPGEKTVGGKQIRDVLTKWKLAFAIHDGVQAGTTSSKTVAWVAANLDARPVASAAAAAVPYRALFIYEKPDKAKLWQLVAVQFSIVDASP